MQQAIAEMANFHDDTCRHGEIKGYLIKHVDNI